MRLHVLFTVFANTLLVAGLGACGTGQKNNPQKPYSFRPVEIPVFLNDIDSRRTY